MRAPVFSEMAWKGWKICRFWVVLVALASQDALPAEELDGTLVFGANSGDRWTLFVWLGHGQPQQLTTPRLDVRNPALSLDSSKVAYATSDGSLWLLDLRSRTSQQLGARFVNGSYGFPAWIEPNLLGYTLYTITPPTEDSDIYA